MLGKPSLFRTAIYCQTHRQFLEPNRIAAVLGVCAINNIFLKVNEYASFIKVFAGLPLIQFTLGVDEFEDACPRSLDHELLVARTVENRLAVGDITRIGDLNGGYRKFRVGGT